MPLSPPATPAPSLGPTPEPGGSINGTVTAEGTGTPLAEICVFVGDATFNFFDTVTDASGNYSVGGLGTGDYWVAFLDCGIPATYVVEFYNDQPDFASADLVAVTEGVKTGGIDAALAVGGSINGTVTEDGTGDPLADICIEAVDTSFTFFGSGVTDASGNYMVGGLGSGDYRVEFFPCGSGIHMSEWYDDQTDFSSADLVAVTQGVKTEGIAAALAVGGSINGTVTEEGTGDPLAEICVSVEDTAHSFFGFGETDASGNYSVGGLGSGDYRLEFSDCGSGTYLSEWYDDQPSFSSADLVAVTQGVKTGGIDAALALGGSINGTVTEEGTGDPLAEICVFVVDTMFNFFRFAETDAAGDYTVGGLGSGDYRLEFSDCGPGTHVSEWYDDQPDFSSADLVAVTQGVKTGGIDAALALGGSINGTVTEEGTGDPLAEICVSVEDTSHNFHGFGFTDTSGNYSVGGLGSGDYRVEFFSCGSGTHLSEWYDDQPDFSSADLVAVTQGSKTAGIDAALALGGSINGTVTEGGTGDPLAEICVSVEDPSHNFHEFGFTDASGNYTVGGLTSGDYAVEFFDCGSGTHLSEWYDDQPDFSSADLVAVTQGVKTEGIDAALGLGGSINGTVTDEETGAPLAEICVLVQPFSNFLQFPETDASGNYSVGGLSSGDYTVAFFDCGFPENYITEWYDDQPNESSADLVAVTQGVKTGGIDAALALGGSINGTVTEEGTGEPLADICVSVEDTSHTFFGFGFTDASGNYSAGALPTGDYTVEFSDCEFFPFTYVTEWYDDRPDFASADLVAVTQGSKTAGIDAALVDSTAPTPTPTPVPGALIFVESFEDIYDFNGDTTPDCGGGDLTITVDPAGPGIVLLAVVGFNGWGSPNDNVIEFDPPLPIAGDGSFSGSFPLPAPGIIATFAGTFDFAADPATVSGTLTIALAANTSFVLCAAHFGSVLTPSPTATPPPTDTPTATPTPGGPTATATPDGDLVSSVQEATVEPSLPETGAALEADGGLSASLWAMIGALVLAAAAGLALFGRRYARAR